MGLLSFLFGGKETSQPTINYERSGDYSFDIVGESHYQDALDEICGGRTENGHKKTVQASIVHEDENKYDNKAICVMIRGKTVGYFNREDARLYRKLLKDNGSAGETATCSARILGGWERAKGDKGHYGVKLDLSAVF
jgi:hypothetical protein